MKWAHREKGFTIVELLVVVVVIAILALITTVAYNGMQQRTKNAAITAAIDAWEKALRIALVDGATPPPIGTCLGRAGDFPAQDGFGVNECLLQDGVSVSGIIFNDAHFTTWATISRPSGVLPVVTYSTGGITLKARAIWVSSVSPAPSKTIDIRWLTQVDGSCSRGVAILAPINGSLAGGYCNLTIYY